ncbi:MAG TPA: tetratricopeptide repeat protein [Polyangia bacterium]|nr:tetratricopeptide repeat protein [Polyangia bacterium]
MSSLTPTPIPIGRTDEVTQPSIPAGAVYGSDGKRVLERSPAQWEAEALATAEEAESREGVAAGALRYAAARMLEDGVGDVVAAADHLQMAVAVQPTQTFRPVLGALRVHAVEAGSTWAATELLDAEAAAAASVAERAELLVEKAYLFEDGLLASEPARQALEEALGLVPAHRGALEALHEIADRTGDAALLRSVVERKLAGAASAPERARLLARLAQLAEADPSRISDALSLYGRALDETEDPADGAGAVARAGLRRAAARIGKDAELLRGLVLEAEATAVGGARAPWLAMAAGLARHRLGTAERAGELVEAARAEAPEDAALLAIAAEDHGAAGRWTRAREALDQQAALTSDLDWAAALLGLAAHIAEQHEGDNDAAAARHHRVLVSRAADPVTLLALERIASRTGDARAQVELAVAAVGRSVDAAERAALALRAAELAETALHDATQAAALARRALEAVPGYAPALHLLERLYPALGRWDEMVGVVEAETVSRVGAEAVSAAAETPPAGEDGSLRLERLGTLYEERLGDPGRALALFGEWASSGVRKPAALRALLRAAEKAGDALVAAEAALRLGTDVPGLSDEASVAWRYRAATIYEERAAADDEAIRAYDAVLALAPAFRPAMEGLARAHERRKNLEALVEVLSRQAASETNPAQASTLEVEAARLALGRIGRPEQALASVARALAFDPANVAAHAEHVRVLARLGRGEELAAALGALAQLVADPAAKAALYRRQSEIFEWQLRRPREALLAIERALSVAMQARPPGTGTAELVQERLYQLLGRSAEVATLQHKRLAATTAESSARGAAPALGAPSPGRRVDLAWRLADAADAVAVLELVLDDAPTEVVALEAHVTFLRRLGRDREAGLALERLAEIAQQPEAKAALWRAAAAARDRTGTRLGEAMLLWERIVDAKPTVGALTVFERHAVRRGDWPRVVLARRKLAEIAPDGPTRAVYLWELGLAHLSAGDLRGADADFERAIDADASFLPAVRALGRLREATGEARSAAELFARLARLTKAATRAADAFRRAARLYAASESSEGGDENDDQLAARCLEEVLALEPEAEADFQALEAILRARADTDRLAQVMRRRASTGTVVQRRDRLLALAALLRERDANDAAAALAEAVELDPSSVQALARLAEVQAELGRPAEAVASLQRVIAASPDPRVVSAAWVRIGDLAERNLADVGAAVEAYRSALLSTPDDVRALTGLVRGLSRRRDWANAALTLRRLATVDPDRDARVIHFMSLGDLLAGAAEDPEGAADALEQALLLDSRHAGAMDRLDAILTELDEPSRLAAALGRFLEIEPHAKARRMRLASLWSGPLASPHRAVDELRIVVAESPKEVPARAELARVLEEAKRLPEAITEHLGLLSVEALRLDSLRALRRLFDRTGQPHRSARAVAALAALGATDAAEIRAVREARVRWTDQTVGAVTTAEFEAVIRHPDERHPATALLASMVEVLPRLYAMSLEDWGVTKADRLGPRSEEPMLPIISRVAALLGLTEGFDIYLARTGTTQVEVEASQPPAVLVPTTLAAMPRQEAYLQLGRQLGRIRAATHAALRVPLKDLGLLIAAGVRTVYPDYGRGALPEDKLNDVSQKIARALPRRHRRAFEQAALSFRDGGVFDSDRWRAALLHTGHRASIVASGDVLGAFDHIARLDRRLAAAIVQSPEELLRAASANIEVIELVNFALGEELATLNRRLGLD